MRKTNQAGVDLIKGFEKLRTTAYRDSAGVWTIGYGHTGPEIFEGLAISAAQAEQYLRADLATAERGVTDALDKRMPGFNVVDDLSDNEFAACVSLAFNIGNAAFAKSSIVRLIVSGAMGSAADNFLLYNKARVKGKLTALKGLTLRREAERKLFLTPDDETEAPIQDDELIIPDEGTPPVPPSQTVESGGAATQVVVGDTSASSPVVSKPDDAPVQASTGSKKSLFATIIGGLTAIPTAIWGLFEKHDEVLKWSVIVGGVILAIYLLRQLVLDVVRMWTAADPKKYSVR